MNTLTSREKQIIELTAFGNSQKEIAELLTISPSTVDVHIKNIKIKTGLQKATELTCAWFVKKYRVPIIDIPERTRRRIAAALLVLSVFTIVMSSSDLLRVFRGNGRVGAKTVSVRPAARKGRSKETLQLITA